MKMLISSKHLFRGSDSLVGNYTARNQNDQSSHLKTANQSPLLWINCGPEISILGDIWDRPNIQLSVVSYMGGYNSLLGPIGCGGISFWRQ